MKFRGVLLKTLDEQHDIDGSARIDPAGVDFDPDLVIPIWRDFNYHEPKDAVGFGKVSRADNGSLEVEGELTAMLGLDKPRLAIGILVSKIEHNVQEARNVVTDCSLMSIAVTDRHADPDQPWIIIE